MPFTENLPQDDSNVLRTGRVVVVCGDLFFGTQVAGLVRDAGFDPVLEMTFARGLGQLNDPTTVGIVLDLETAGVDVSAVRPDRPDNSTLRVIAFGPHVQVHRLEAARAAGCDVVMTRGQITSSPAAIRNAFLGTQRTGQPMTTDEPPPKSA